MNNENYKKFLGKNIKISGIEKSSNEKIFTGYSEEDGKFVYLLSENADNAKVIAVIHDNFGNTDKLVAAKSSTILYEPSIKEKIGNNYDYEYTCLYEKTCGSIIYIVKNFIKYYLLIENDSGHIGFPKGHVEYGESEIETAKREVFEETGLKIDIDPQTRQEYTYTTSLGIIKNCVYFYSEFKEELIELQPEEIVRCWLVPYDEAYELLNYPQDKIIFQKAAKINE